MKIRNALFGVVFIAVSILLLFIVFKIINQQNYIIENKQIALEIIHSLEKYESENGHYPKTLDDLIPLYLKKIPALKYGNWFYRKESGNEFSIGFSNGEIGPIYIYDSKDKKWHGDTR